MGVPINYWAVLVAAIINMILGWLWYGPLFGKKWMRLAGVHPDGKGMAKQMTITFIGALLMAYVLAHSLVFASVYTLTSGVAAGLMVGFWTWIGFIAPVTLGVVLWEGKSWKLWWLNNGYYLVLLLINGVLLSLWM